VLPHWGVCSGKSSWRSWRHCGWRAFRAGPVAFARAADGLRELFLRRLLRQFFSDGDFMDYIERLPHGLSPEDFDAAVESYLRERGVIP
jgi:hypothetical protein